MSETTRIVVAMLVAAVVTGLIFGCPSSGPVNPRTAPMTAQALCAQEQVKLTREQNEILLRIATALEVMAEIDAEKPGGPSDG